MIMAGRRKEGYPFMHGKTIDIINDTAFPLADANGNCVSFIDNAGNVQAHYTYDAFGNTVSQTGAMADDFRVRFSSKYLDDETGLYYYGFRYFAPALGRWVSRDPVEELGGVMLYGFVKNGAVYKWDMLGMNDGEEKSSKWVKIGAACVKISLEVAKIKKLPWLICDPSSPNDLSDAELPDYVAYARCWLEKQEIYTYHTLEKGEDGTITCEECAKVLKCNYHCAMYRKEKGKARITWDHSEVYCFDEKGECDKEYDVSPSNRGRMGSVK